MSKTVKDGWHIVKGQRVYTENGYIVRGVSYDQQTTVYPYEPYKGGGGAYLTSTPIGTLDRLRKGKIIMK